MKDTLSLRCVHSSTKLLYQKFSMICKHIKKTFNTLVKYWWTQRVFHWNYVRSAFLLCIGCVYYNFRNCISVQCRQGFPPRPMPLLILCAAGMGLKDRRYPYSLLIIWYLLCRFQIYRISPPMVYIVTPQCFGSNNIRNGIGRGEKSRSVSLHPMFEKT